MWDNPTIFHRPKSAGKNIEKKQILAKATET